MFAFIVTANYGALADKFIDLHGEKSGKPMSRNEKKALLASRLRACSWGPRVTKAKKESTSPEETWESKKAN
jgi:hypothetical protein